jgi:3'-phosphoadenosine 5'-phosphosulfate (PAPS) 3'-phosphatase
VLKPSSKAGTISTSCIEEFFALYSRQAQKNSAGVSLAAKAHRTADTRTFLSQNNKITSDEEGDTMLRNAALAERT